MANVDTGDIQDFLGANSTPTKDAQQQFNLEQMLEDYISGRGKKDTSKQGGFLNSPIFDILGSIMTRDPMFAMKKQKFMAEMDLANQQAEDSKMTALGAYLKAKGYFRGLKEQDILNQPRGSFLKSATENVPQGTDWETGSPLFKQEQGGTQLNEEMLNKLPLSTAEKIKQLFVKEAPTYIPVKSGQPILKKEGIKETFLTAPGEPEGKTPHYSWTDIVDEKGNPTGKQQQVQIFPDGTVKTIQGVTQAKPSEVKLDPYQNFEKDYPEFAGKRGSSEKIKSHDDNKLYTYSQKFESVKSQEVPKINVAIAGRSVFANIPDKEIGAYFYRPPGGGTPEWRQPDGQGGYRVLSGEEVKNLHLQVKELTPTETTKTMKQMAPKVIDLANEVNRNIDAVERLGPLASRYQDFMSGKVGTKNPEFITLKDNVELLSTLLARMHVGARGGRDIIENFKQMINVGRASPENMKAATAAIIRYANKTGESTINPGITFVRSGIVQSGPKKGKKVTEWSDGSRTYE